MESSNQETVKRGSSGKTSERDSDINKLKRSEIPDDISSAILKKEESDKNLKEEEDGLEKTDENAHMKTTKRRVVSHGYHLREGNMRHGMEDYVVAKWNETKGHELGLYGIFDGHSGHEAAEYLHKYLFENILKQPDFWDEPERAVKRAYEATDNDILECLVHPRGGGSTAVTAMLIDREKLVVSNVGDSRAVLCKNGVAKAITADHKPLKEKEEVENRGGFVSKEPGNVPRVDGNLAMARAFGDEGLKQHITSEPDVYVEEIDEETEFLVIASDGLWNVITNQEAVDCVRGLEDGQEAAQELIEEAVLRQSQDDISCVVVTFHY